MTSTSTLHTTAAALDDAAVLRRMRDGDELAFRAVYERHVDAIAGYVSARIGPAAAEDVIAATFATAWSARANLRSDATSARPWLYGIASNLLQRHRSGERRWQRGVRALAVPEHAAEDADVDPTGITPGDGELACVLAQLARSEREVLLLVAVGELSVGEAAAALGITSTAARVRLHRARTRMRRLLGAPDLFANHDDEVAP